MTAELFIENEDWINQLKNIRSFRVFKMPRLLKALLFLLNQNREDVCFPKSSLLDWKKAKHYVSDELAKLMGEYKCLGAKPEEVRRYNTINYVERILSEFQQEEVDAYHLGVGKLFRWANQAVALRKNDIVRRKALSKKAAKDREDKIADSETRANNLETYLIEAEEKFKDDHRDEIEAYERYQEELRNKDANEYGEEEDDGEEKENAN